MFTDNTSNQMKTDYNAGKYAKEMYFYIQKTNLFLTCLIKLDMMDSLDMFQNLVDNGSISPNSLSLNNDEQLNNFNVWLAQLTESIENEQPNNNSNNYTQPTPNAATNYSEMLLQFNSNTLPVDNNNSNNNNNDLYPTSIEEDMYVRSNPVIQPQQPTVDFNPSTPTKLYGEFNMPPMMDTLNQFGYPTNVTEAVPQMSGLRHHYSNVPGIVSNGNFFTPDLRSAQNLGSSKDNVKYKKSPTNSQEKEEKTADAFKPIKPTYHESKKNVTTMMNVFASVDGSNGKKSTPTSPIDETKQSPAKKSTKDILDLLVSDMSDLTIKKEEQVEDEEKDESLYPTSPTTTIEKHKKLLKQLSQWVNKNYSDKNNQAERITSSSSPSVQVQ